jgi:hypothetical protein
MSSRDQLDVPVERAFAFVERATGARRAALLSRSRKWVRSRALFAWALRHHNVSYPRIGEALARDRSAAVQLARVAQDLRRVDPEFAAKCDGYAVTTAHSGPLLFARVVLFIEQELGVDREGLCGKRQLKHELEARAMFAWAMRRFRKPQLSWARIGAMIDHDRTSAANLDLLSDRLRRDNADFALSCDRLIEHLLQHKEATDGRTSH